MKLHGEEEGGTGESGLWGWGRWELEGPRGAFPTSRGIFGESLMSQVCWRISTVQAHSNLFLLVFPFSERKQGPVWIQGQTGDRQGVQTDYVILVMNASSTFRASAALKAEHSPPSWTMVSLIMSNALGSAFLPFSSSSFPSSSPSLTPPPPLPIPDMTHP